MGGGSRAHRGHPRLVLSSLDWMPPKRLPSRCGAARVRLPPKPLAPRPLAPRRRADITCSVDQTRLHRGETEERRSARRKTERKKGKRSCVNRRARLRGRVRERGGSGGSRILNAAACLRAANRSCYLCGAPKHQAAVISTLVDTFRRRAGAGAVEWGPLLWLAPGCKSQCLQRLLRRRPPGKERRLPGPRFG